ncbi:hypothetical protein H6P81_013253 [Aristolochia fimbriata]|uniref:Uncharacterized protein n=1 Tax=Aristolochia fimbriata TaxID=158543 RepID=A0AAV7EE87_ARIFI|nr:hypothetical protein H6P81_013253 [Aristolochia fimbriata]
MQKAASGPSKGKGKAKAATTLRPPSAGGASAQLMVLSLPAPKDSSAKKRKAAPAKGTPKTSSTMALASATTLASSRAAAMTSISSAPAKRKPISQKSIIQKKPATKPINFSSQTVLKQRSGPPMQSKCVTIIPFVETLQSTSFVTVTTWVVESTSVEGAPVIEVNDESPRPVETIARFACKSHLTQRNADGSITAFVGEQTLPPLTHPIPAIEAWLLSFVVRDTRGKEPLVDNHVGFDTSTLGK